MLKKEVTNEKLTQGAVSEDNICGLTEASVQISGNEIKTSAIGLYHVNWEILELQKKNKLKSSKILNKKGVRASNILSKGAR